MPTYNFRCKKCGHIFEDFKGMHEANPNCEKYECRGDTEVVFQERLEAIWNCDTGTPGHGWRNTKQPKRWVEGTVIDGKIYKTKK